MRKQPQVQYIPDQNHWDAIIKILGETYNQGFQHGFSNAPPEPPPAPEWPKAGEIYIANYGTSAEEKTLFVKSLSHILAFNVKSLFVQVKNHPHCLLTTSIPIAQFQDQCRAYRDAVLSRGLKIATYQTTE